MASFSELQFNMNIQVDEIIDENWGIIELQARNRVKGCAEIS